MEWLILTARYSPDMLGELFTYGCSRILSLRDSSDILRPLFGCELIIREHDRKLAYFEKKWKSGNIATVER